MVPNFPYKGHPNKSIFSNIPLNEVSPSVVIIMTEWSRCDLDDSHTLPREELAVVQSEPLWTLKPLVLKCLAYVEEERRERRK